jgi:hypothetical protein
VSERSADLMLVLVSRREPVISGGPIAAVVQDASGIFPNYAAHWQFWIGPVVIVLVAASAHRWRCGCPSVDRLPDG